MCTQRLWVPSLFVFALTGCGLNSSSTGPGSSGIVSPGPIATASSGNVHGGNQPVTGSTIQLYAVGSNGYGSAGTALLSTTVTTSDGSSLANSNANSGNANNTLPAGAFTISGDYTCPAGNPEVYITANGGNPGLNAGTNNSAISLMTALSDCNTLKANAATTFITINEVTTVASVYALAQFISKNGIGAYGYSNQGLLNAFATVNNLVNTSMGTARSQTPGGNGLVPQQEINSLANILTPCINSINATSPDCSALFSAVSVSGPTGSPTNTLPAVLEIALAPGNTTAQPTRVSTIFNLAFANPAFQPALISPGPNDWTMALDFAGTGGGNQDLAIDGIGNVWVASFGSGGSTSSVAKMSPLGVRLYNVPTGNGAYSAYGIAMDLTNNAWVASDDPTNPSVIYLANNGNSIAGPVTFTETSSPVGVAVDGNDNAWITNSGSNSVTELGLNGGGIGNISPDNTGFTGGGLSGPLDIAIDGGGNAWVTDYNNGAGNGITEIGANQTLTGFTGNGLQGPAGVAIDASNNVWVANYFSGSTAVSEFNNSGAAINTFSGGGIHNPISIAVDGANNIWVANEYNGSNSISELTSGGVAVSPATTGYQGGQVGHLNFPWVLRIDGSGNVWVANHTGTTIATSSGNAPAFLTEFIGLAAPAIAPLAQAVQNGQIGQAPGTPIPVVLVSPTLPYYTPGVSYYAQLVAGGGNTGSYTWSVTSGAPPAGMTFSASGGITGSSAATGSTTFNVKVCDQANAANCTTGAITLTASSSLPLGGGESMLSGRYIMRLGGFNNGTVASSGLVNGYAVVQSVVFDGAGHITAVSEDFNNPNSHSSLASSSAGTGSYTLGTDHRGLMVLNYSGITLQYAISVGNLNGSSIAQDMRLIEFDDTRPSGAHPYGIASGVGKLQTSISLATNQAYVFGFEGETPCTNYGGNGCTNGAIFPYGAVTAVGRFFVNNANGITGGVEDAGANSTSYNGITLSGTYTTPDANGRGTMTITSTGTTYPAAPSNFIYYVVSPTEIYMLSIDPHTNYSLMSGDVLAQTTTFTPSYTLSGNFVAYESAPDNGDGISFFPNDSGTALVYIAAVPGQQMVSAVVDENDGGNVKPDKQQGTFPYTIDSNGRMILAGGGGGTPLFYFANNSQGFATEQPSSGNNSGDTGLLTIEQQSAGPFSCTSANGTYFFGTVQPPVPLGVSNGSILQTGTGTGTITLDNSDPSGVLTQGAAQSVTCTSADIAGPNGTTGRFTFVSTGAYSVGYAISTTKTVIMTANPGAGTPTVLVIQQ
jgi:hypothetical protein